MAKDPESEVPRQATTFPPKPVPAPEEFVRWPLSTTRKARTPEIIQQGYDPRPQEDQARRNIAYCLIALLFFICVANFVTLWGTAIQVEDVMKILQILLSPVIALVSAMTGFYYGTKSKP